ncbi:hypothetical protein KAR91_79290, partial [Candidatus Pacearchaeota archaeon]|nr:hypothetical protein [Candidatus Pacearchaeota archaeon]
MYRNIRPSGDPLTCKYVIVGEQPGNIELRTNEPFTGPTGRLLNECLTKARIARADCYLTNVIKTLDKPLDHFITFSRKGPTETEEFQLYLKLLQEELASTKGIIIAV